PGVFADAMASFSSCGPTDDGRLKPDLTLPGEAIVSAFNDGNVAREDCAFTSMSGTSMATPAAAGFAALVRQYFTDGWHPSGAARQSFTDGWHPAAAARAEDGFRPSAALVKATLLNSAVSMEQANPIP